MGNLNVLAQPVTTKQTVFPGGLASKDSSLLGVLSLDISSLSLACLPFSHDHSSVAWPSVSARAPSGIWLLVLVLATLFPKDIYTIPGYQHEFLS